MEHGPFEHIFPVENRDIPASYVSLTEGKFLLFLGLTPPKTNMTMIKQPFEDVSPIKNGDFPMSCEFSGGLYQRDFS